MKKMKKSWSKVLSVLLVTVMILSLGACGKSSKDTSSDNSKDSTATTEVAATGDAAVEEEFPETTINIRLMNEFTNMDRILEEYYIRVKDDPKLSKIKINLSFVAGADYNDKLGMALSAQEDIDLMFSGSWHGLSTNISSGAFKDLTEYFQNPEYPGLMAGFSEDYTEAAKTYVQNDAGEVVPGIYSIPLAEAFEDIRGLAYREDLRVKYNIPEITSDEILAQYLETVSANEPDLIGWSMYNGFFHMETPYYTAAHDNVFFQQIVGEEAPFYLALSEDGKTVLNAVTIGDDQSQFDTMPEGYNYDFMSAYQIERTKWEKYLDPTRVTADGTGGKAIISYTTLSSFLNDQTKLQEDAEYMEQYPDASLGFYVTEEAQRNMEQGAIVSEMKSNNFLVVPAWSEKTEAVMLFLDWMFASKENHDLFQYGIEGTDWEAIGDDGYKFIEVAADDKYTMPGYSFTWNPNYIRYSDQVVANPVIKSYFEYQNNPSTYTLSPIAGFAFNATGVETEVANVTALANEIKLRFAIYGDETESTIQQFHADMENVGLEKVRTSLIEQMQKFLDTKNAQ